MAKEHYKWGVVLVACMAIFIIVLDSSAMMQTFNALSLILLLGFIVSLFLPKNRTIKA